MCDGHDHGHPTPAPRLSRRTLLGAGGLALASVGLPTRQAQAAAGRLAAGSTQTDPLRRMALHVHASFSEGDGSMGSQLQCARDAGVDVVWFTEHDWRMQQHCYRTFHSFDRLNGVFQYGKAWQWVPQVVGAPAATEGGIVTSPVSPRDPSTTPGALRVAVRASSTTADAGDSNLYFAGTGSSRHNYRGNLTGTTIRVEVFPRTVGGDGWGEVRLMLSNHPATGGRPAGQYYLSYRLGASGSPRTQGLVGIVPVKVKANAWNSLALTPIADVRRLWPDLVAEDNALLGLWLGASARLGGQGEAVFDYLRFERGQPVQLSPFGVQRGIIGAHAARFPDVVAHAGQEVSFLPEHLGWLGGDDYFLSYPTDSLEQPASSVDTNLRARSLVRRGGAIAINHPFGAEGVGNGDGVDDDAIAALAAQYLGYGAYGATMLEVGYAERGGATLDQHLALWDTLSRNGIYLTGTGVNDNHEGLVGSTGPDWLADDNRFATSVWSAGTTQADLLGRLASGQAFTSELTSGAVAVDLRAPGVPMGSVSVLPGARTRTLTVGAAGLPSGSSIELVQGAVDYAGAASPATASRVVETIPAKRLRKGSAAVPVATGQSSFVRAVVRDRTGRGIAVSNPVWLLAEASRTPVPTARRAVAG